MLEFKLQRFAEGDDTGGGEPTKIKIGEAEFTPEELQERLKSYDKLQAQFTKVSQENSELRKTSESAKAWLEFEQQIAQLAPEQQQKFVEQTNTFFASARTGTVTHQDISGINKAIKTAEKAGQEEVADELKDARDAAVQRMWLNEQFDDLAEQAEDDGITFKKREFENFLAKYLEDEGYDEDEDFDEREIKRAYRLYRAEKQEKAADAKRKGDLPSVGTGSSGVGVGSKESNTKAPKSIKEAAEMARKMLGG